LGWSFRRDEAPGRDRRTKHQPVEATQGLLRFQRRAKKKRESRGKRGGMGKDRESSGTLGTDRKAVYEVIRNREAKREWLRKRKNALERKTDFHTAV